MFTVGLQDLMIVGAIAIGLLVLAVVLARKGNKAAQKVVDQATNNPLVHNLLDRLHLSVPLDEHNAALQAVRQAPVAPAPTWVISTPPQTVTAPSPQPSQTFTVSPTAVKEAVYTPNPLSNTPDWRRWSDTSPEGYPLIYGLTMAPDGSKVVDPRLPARLYYDGQTFTDVAEIRDYMVRLRTRADNMSLADASVDVPGVGFPIFTPDVTTTTLAVFDAAPTDGLKYFHLLTAEHYALQNRGMTRAMVNAMVSAANGGAPPDGWLGSAQQAYRG